MLLMAAKDVASALTDLINSTKNSSGKSATDPAMDNLKVSAKVNVTPSNIFNINVVFYEFSSRRCVFHPVYLLISVSFLDHGYKCVISS